jgi:hypothetical protein
MKKALTLLALSLTYVMANISTPSLTTNSQEIDTRNKSKIIIREIRTFRDIRQNRKVRQTRTIQIEEKRKAPSFRLTRASREIRENRFIAQTIRESRNVHYVRIQKKVRLASVK